MLGGRQDLGTIAFLRDGKLVAVDLSDCLVRTVARAATTSGPVSWSADGRWIAFGPHVVGARGGPVLQPLPDVMGPLVWAPRSDELAGVSRSGGVFVGGPGLKARQLLPDGWGATTVAWSAGGTLAVSRSLYLKTAPPYHQEIWIVDTLTGGKRELYHLPKTQVAPPLLYGFSPDGRWLLAWQDTLNSASLAADGLPLVAIRVADGRTAVIPNVHGTLVYRDFLSWCGNMLAYVVNQGGREVTHGDRIGLAGPAPAWPAVQPGRVAGRTPLSFVSPACAPSATATAGIAAAVGPAARHVGAEHRRIWLLLDGGNWHPLGPTPPPTQSDELPTWSADGGWIAFVRTGPLGDDGRAPGSLYLLRLPPQPDGQATVVGPVAALGSTNDYGGHYGWANQLAWWTPLR